MPHPYHGLVDQYDLESVMTAMCVEWSDDALLEFYVMNLDALGQMGAIYRISYFGDKGMSLLLERFPQMDERDKELALDVLAWNGKEAFADEIAAISVNTRAGAVVSGIQAEIGQFILNDAGEGSFMLREAIDLHQLAEEAHECLAVHRVSDSLPVWAGIVVSLEHG